MGFQLLNRAIAHAKGRGCTEVWGHVVAKDARQTPYLVDWYRRRGFVVGPVDSRRGYVPSDALHTVSLKLH